MTTGDPATSEQPLSEAMENHYEIIIKDFLDKHWVQWFEGLTLTRMIEKKSGQAFTKLSGKIPDQAALLSLLFRILDLNLTLILVRQSHPGFDDLEEIPEDKL